MPKSLIPQDTREMIASRAPEFVMANIDCVSIGHIGGVEFEEAFSAWKYKDAEDGVASLAVIVGKYWKVGTWADHPCFAKVKEDLCLQFSTFLIGKLTCNF